MKHLLPQVKKYFKTNLHTHSTISDGRFTPEQVKLLMDQGVDKKDAIKQVAKRMNVPKNDVYMEAMEL